MMSVIGEVIVDVVQMIRVLAIVIPADRRPETMSMTEPHRCRSLLTAFELFRVEMMVVDDDGCLVVENVDAVLIVVGQLGRASRRPG